MDIQQQFNLHYSLRNEFGEIAVKKLQTWEKIQRKIARYRNHLHFTLHCKHHSVVPVSLRLKCSMASHQALDIINKAQRALMNARIGEIHHVLKSCQSQNTDLDEELFTWLPSNLYDGCRNWVAHAHKDEYRKCRERQQNKFARLKDQKCSNTLKKKEDKPIMNVSQEEMNAVKSRWVVNCSSRSLSSSEVSLLNKGLNFAISPIKIPVNDIITNVESACRIIGNDEGQADRLRSDVMGSQFFCIDYL